MRTTAFRRRSPPSCWLPARLLAADVLLTNVVVYDGTGSEPFRGAVRIEGERITAVAPHLQPRPARPCSISVGSHWRRASSTCTATAAAA